MILFKPSDKEHTKTIIGLGFLSVFSLMMLVTWLSMSTLESVNTGMADLIENMEEKTGKAYQMRDVIRLRSGAVNTLVNTMDAEEREKLFAQLDEHTRVFSNSRDALSALGSNEREQLILAKITDTDVRVANAYQQAHRELNSARQDQAAIRKALSSVHLQELVLLDHLNDLVKLEKQLASEQLQNHRKTYQDTQKLLLLIVAAAFALSIVISVTVIARVANANRKIAHLANHDDLTGLHNRRSFEQHLEQTVAMAGRSESSFGILYIDLDRFKIVNDTCGHHAGDQLLIQLTTMMRQRLRKSDIFARVGGDEFAIIAQGKSFADIQTLAEELRVLVNDFVFHYEQQTFKVSLSMGVAPIDGQISSIEQVLADVDSACYVAKQSGRNRVHVTQDDDLDVVQYRNNLAGVQAIRKALTDNRLALFYQPIFQLNDYSQQIAHCEILLRIKNENGDVYSPAQFIPIAEKYNVMNEIDQWVFSNVCDWLAENQSSRQIPRLLINLSGMSFADDEFNEFIVERLSRGDIDASHIAFEVSEGAVVRNFRKVSVFIEKVKNLGCELALDDFGSGFSSFNYMKKLPIDYIKIDGKLVRDIANNEIDRKMIAALNQISHSVGARTIAEFVEDNASLQCLRALDVDFAQGYGLHMPAPLSELAAAVNKPDQNTGTDSVEKPVSQNKTLSNEQDVLAQQRKNRKDDPDDVLKQAS